MTKKPRQKKQIPDAGPEDSSWLPASLTTSARLSQLADEALRAVNFDPSQYDRPDAPTPVEVLSFSKTGRINLKGQTARDVKIEEVKKRLNTGYYNSPQVTEQLAEKLSNELSRKKRKGNKGK